MAVTFRDVVACDKSSIRVWGLRLIGAITHDMQDDNPRKKENIADQRSSLARCAPSALISGKPSLPAVLSGAGTMLAGEWQCTRESGKEGKLNPEAELMSAVGGGGSDRSGERGRKAI